MTSIDYFNAISASPIGRVWIYSRRMRLATEVYFDAVKAAVRERRFQARRNPKWGALIAEVEAVGRARDFFAVQSLEPTAP